MTDVEDAWKAYAAAMNREPSELPGKNVLCTLRTAGRSRHVVLWALRHHEQRLNTVLPRCLKAACEKTSDPYSVLDHVDNAHKLVAHALQSLQQLQEVFPHPHNPQQLCRRLHLRVRAHLSSSLPSGFPQAVYRFFVAYLLKSESASPPPDVLENMSLDENRDNRGAEKVCSGEENPLICQRLATLGLSRVAQDALSWAVFERMDELVAMRTSSTSTRVIPELLQWVHQFAAPCVSKLLGDGSLSSDASQWRMRLVFHLHESVCTIRTERLLTLIDEFPKSLPALHDLRDCILSTDKKPFVATSLRDQFVKSLLNAGTLTDEILQQYVKTIRTSRFLDPTGVILDTVNTPVRNYLRRRPDTVRCIVSGMTGNGDLYEELERGRSGAIDLDIATDRDDEGDVTMHPHRPESVSSSTGGSFAMNVLTEGDEDADCQSIDGDYYANLAASPNNYVNWKPDPIDAPVSDSTWRKRGDAIATLVAIYGSSEQIVAEYRGSLADKLVSNFEVDLEREERILNLLIERFGSDAMHDCWIMLKDVRDSREALQIAQTELGKVSEQGEEKENEVAEEAPKRLDGFETTVISKEFWPKLLDEGSFAATTQLESQMRLFSKTFEKTKAPRKLVWQHGLGTVEVNIKFENGREVVTNVSPMQATILCQFAEHGRMSLKQLGELMKVEDTSLLRRKVQALGNLGYIRSCGEVDGSEAYEAAEDGVGAGTDGYGRAVGDEARGDVDDTDEEGDGAGQDDDSMGVYETYIMAMLQNLKQLSLEQIHSMLQRFVQTPVYDRSQAQLSSFLASLIAKGKVEVAAGVYRVKKQQG